MWYWGDASNKAPEVWQQRDLINLLYGTPPLFMLTPKSLGDSQGAVVQSYKRVCPTTRRIGYDEMLSHEFLTPDHTLQRTTWSSGISIIVNFADKAQILADGSEIPPLDALIK